MTREPGLRSGQGAAVSTPPPRACQHLTTCSTGLPTALVTPGRPRGVSGIPGLQLLDASSTPPPLCAAQTHLWTASTASEEASLLRPIPCHSRDITTSLALEKGSRVPPPGLPSGSVSRQDSLTSFLNVPELFKCPRHPGPQALPRPTAPAPTPHLAWPGGLSIAQAPPYFSTILFPTGRSFPISLCQRPQAIQKRGTV